MHRFKLRYALPVSAVLCVAVIGGAAWVDAKGGRPAKVSVPHLNAAPLIASTGVSETVSAVVSGTADAVELVVTDPETGEETVKPMHRDRNELWTASIPSSLIDEGKLIYRVTAAYDEVTKSSSLAELVVLDNLRQSTPTLVDNTGRTMQTATLGDGATELGVRGGKESAAELPPSFAVDQEERVHVLDAVKGRVVVLDGPGVSSTLDLTGVTTTASDVVLGEGGTTFVLDQAKDAIEEIAANGNRTFRAGLGVRSMPLGALLVHMTDSGTTYIREATQGRFVPVLKNRQKVSASDRKSDTRAGIPTTEGDLAVEVAERTVTYALSEDRISGYRISFPDQVLDASETVVDDTGAIWSLVGVYNATNDTASKYLVRIDPDTGVSRMVSVGGSVPGDVTKRLVNAGRGVALMEGEGNTLSFIRFQTI